MLTNGLIRFLMNEIRREKIDAEWVKNVSPMAIVMAEAQSKKEFSMLSQEEQQVLIRLQKEDMMAYMQMRMEIIMLVEAEDKALIEVQKIWDGHDVKRVGKFTGVKKEEPQVRKPN